MLSIANQKIHKHLSEAYEWCLNMTDKGQLYPIDGYEGVYGVTENGDVWSYPKKNHLGASVHGGKWIRKYISNSGYYQCALQKKGYKKFYPLIHRLVARALIPNPENKRVVNHKDGNKLNNHVSNLEWATDKENSRHAWETGLNAYTDSQRAVVQKNLIEKGAGTRFRKGQKLGPKRVRLYCKYGHPVYGENLQVIQGKSRTCKICFKRRGKEFRKKWLEKHGQHYQSPCNRRGN